MTTQTTSPAAEPVARDAEKASPERRPMREDDLLDFVWIADPRISPDGSRVVYTRVTVDKENDEYQTALWIVPATGGPGRALTPGPRDGQARWSPDGKSIAFVRSPEAKKPGQLYVLPMDGGEAVALPTLEKGASSPAWSPDGKRLAFLSGTNPALDDPKKEKPKNEPARVVTRPTFRENNVGFEDRDHLSHVWVVDLDGGTPHPLTNGKFVEGAPKWSRDGRHVLFVSDRRDDPWFTREESKLYAVPADLAAPTDGGRLLTVIDHPGTIGSFTESADGRFAVIANVRPEDVASYEQMDLLLFEGAWPITQGRVVNATRDHAIGEGVNSDQHPPRGGGELPLAFSADGRAVLVMGSRRGAAQLLRVDLATGGVTALTPGDRDLVSGTVTPDGRNWALVIGSVERPGDLHQWSEGGRLVRIEAPNEALFAGLALGSVEEITYPSFDGREIHGWLVRPPNAKSGEKLPAIVQIHGGPHTAYGWGFFHEFHALAGAGYAVLYTNPRGSTSYGLEFANVIQYKFPGDDAKDLLQGAEELVKRGIADTKRIGVTGGSGGGLLTNWLLTMTERFAAAITQRCVSDWASMMYSADFAMFLPYWFKKQPYEDPQEYLERSPATYAAKITTPLMIIHSEEDWRTPIAQGEAMFRALKHQKKPVVMVRFPGENHELSRSGAPSRRVQNQHHIRAWFDRWLMGKEAPEYGV